MGTGNLMGPRKNGSKKGTKKSKRMLRILTVVGYSFLSFICSEEILVRPNGVIDTKIDLQQIFLLQDKSTIIADGIIENKNSSFTEKASIVLSQGFKIIQDTASNESFRKGLMITGGVSFCIFFGAISVSAKQLPAGVNSNVIEHEYTQTRSKFAKWYNEFSNHLPGYSEIFYLFGGIAIGVAMQVAIDAFFGTNKFILKHYCYRKTSKLRKTLQQTENYLLHVMQNNKKTYELLLRVYTLFKNFNSTVKDKCPDLPALSDKLLLIEKRILTYEPKNPRL